MSISWGSVILVLSALVLVYAIVLWWPLLFRRNDPKFLTDKSVAIPVSPGVVKQKKLSRKEAYKLCIIEAAFIGEIGRAHV